MSVRSVTEKHTITKEALRGVAHIQHIIANEDKDLYRPMPWRHIDNPYAVLISEVMLQQTQVTRVSERYPRFLRRFPTVEALATAPIAAVVQEWQGLGYNRRALFLQRAAQQIVEQHNGQIPQSTEELAGLPGIGPATAGAVRVYAYNLPALFIETNIRRVFIFYCFPSRKQVEDSEIEPLLERALPPKDCRTWYYALTDLGAVLRARIGHNPNCHAQQYHRQSPFEGSVRQLRGAIIRHLSTNGPTAMATLKSIAIEHPHNADIERVIATLSDEGFVVQEHGSVYLRGST